MGPDGFAQKRSHDAGTTRAKLADILDSHRVVICVGSGGVGKTTTAAAIALRAAMQGKRVLCLTIDPARRLANSLGLAEMTVDEQIVPPELFAAQGVACSGTLAVMMLDTKRTFDALVIRHASSDEARDRILQNRIYRYVSGSLAGTQEYMAMEKLHAVREDDWDLIVLDTPPTSNALDFLDAPERLVEMLDSPAMRWFIDAFEGAGKASMGLVGRGATILIKGLSRFTGTEFLEMVAEFVTGLNDMFGGFRDRARAISGALKSPDVAYVIVTSPNPLAMIEALFFHKRLATVGIEATAFVVNAVHHPPEAVEQPQDVLMDALRAGAPRGTDHRKLLAQLEQAAKDEAAWAEVDRRRVEYLAGQVAPTVAFAEVPAQDRDVHDLSALAVVAANLAGRT